MDAYHLILYALAVAFAIFWVVPILQALRSPLQRIPGPWYAPFTALHVAYAYSTGRIWKDVVRYHEKYGKVVRVGPRHVWVSELDAVKKALVSIDLPKVATYGDLSRDRSSVGIFGEIRPEPHKKLRKFMWPAFTVGYVDKVETAFAHTVQHLLAKYVQQADGAASNPILDGVQEADLMDDFHNAALDMMGEATFGRGFGQTISKDTANEDDIDAKVWASIPHSMVHGVAQRYTKLFIKRFFRRLGWELRFEWPTAMIHAIKVMVRRRSQAIERREDLLQRIVEEGKRPDNEEPWTEREMLDQLAELLVGGSETTSFQTTMLFVELARNPGIRAKLLASIPALSIYDNQIITGKEVRTDQDTYEYLDACIKEACRLHPIAGEMGRRTGPEPVEMGGYIIPPYTIVCVSYRALHRDAEYWPQPLRFWPERWLPEDKRGDAPAANTEAYFPFSAGTHSCVGKNFAWAEMRCVCANILARYDILEVPDQHVDFRQNISMSFTTGHWRARLKPRIRKV